MEARERESMSCIIGNSAELEGNLTLSDRLKVFKGSTFDPEAYVTSKCQRMNEKRRQRHLSSYLVELKKASAEEMGKSVYANYAAFIRTSKEISALEDLKKLQTPLYEEYYNCLITCSTSCMKSNVSNSKREDSARGFPPKSRSPSRGPLVGSPSRATDTISCSKTPGSGGSRELNIKNGDDEALHDGVSARVTNWRGLVVDTEQESSQSVALSEIEMKWKEELDQELERKRQEIMRQAGLGSSPRDRGLSRQREKSRFASPGK